MINCKTEPDGRAPLAPTDHANSYLVSKTVLQADFGMVLKGRRSGKIGAIRTVWERWLSGRKRRS